MKEIGEITELKNISKMDEVRFNYFYQQNRSLKGSKTEEGIFGGMFNNKEQNYFLIAKPNGSILNIEYYRTNEGKIEKMYCGFNMPNVPEQELEKELSNQLNCLKTNLQH